MNHQQDMYQHENTVGTPLVTMRREEGISCSAKDGHCITCSDEAVPVQIVRLDAASGLAMVIRVDEPEIQEEIDISLLERVAPGDMVLAHGGVAIGCLGVDDHE